jgi:hypothetical protein
MRLLLSLIVLMLVVGHIFSLDMGLGPGLSAKNAILYVAAVFIVFRIVVSGEFKMEMAGFLGCYFLLIIYAITSWLVAGLLIQYRSYELLASGIFLKTYLIDPLIFFLAFMLGARTTDDAIKLIKVLCIACVLANIATLGDAFHVFSLGNYVSAGGSGRMNGPLGEPNQYGDFIVIFLPPMCAAMSLSQGFRRVLWLMGIAVSAAALLTTASRAAFVAALLSSIFGVYMMRNYLSASKIMSWAVRVFAIGVVIVAIVSIEFKELLTERLIGESEQVSVGAISSGRTEFWMQAIEKMMSEPISLVTGFGWDTYSIMGFNWSAHSYYLTLWFNLGIPGLILGVLLFVILIREARSALPAADAESRVYLMAFLFSMLALVIAIMFNELFTPLSYIWSYAGVAIRIALNARQAAHKVRAPRAAALAH